MLMTNFYVGMSLKDAIASDLIFFVWYLMVFGVHSFGSWEPKFMVLAGKQNG